LSSSFTSGVNYSFLWIVARSARNASAVTLDIKVPAPLRSWTSPEVEKNWVRFFLLDHLWVRIFCHLFFENFSLTFRDRILA